MLSITQATDWRWINVPKYFKYTRLFDHVIERHYNWTCSYMWWKSNILSTNLCCCVVFLLNILSNTWCEKSFVIPLIFKIFLSAIAMFQKLQNRKDERIIFVYLDIIKDDNEVLHTVNINTDFSKWRLTRKRQRKEKKILEEDIRWKKEIECASISTCATYVAKKKS